jgi:hypothetical protein
LRRLLLSACLALTGCAYNWQPTHAPIPADRWRYVYTDDANRLCRAHGLPWDTIACAVWGDGNCTMYLPPQAARWIIEHEQKHCQGFTH